MSVASVTNPGPPAGLFAGLITLDLIYLAEGPPKENQKVGAEDFTIAAGGPACNAAVAFAHLGGRARLTGGLGRHPLAGLVAHELDSCGVQLQDLDLARPDPPPVSSVVVSRADGARSVVSRNAVGRQVSAGPAAADLVRGADVLLLDGHQMALGRELARCRGTLPLVVDAGSWKPGFETLLERADYVLCSADFRPPGCAEEGDVYAYLAGLGVRHSAVTHGAGAITFRTEGAIGRLDIPAPPYAVVDTLGAGDIFHGAFSYYCLRVEFAQALAYAARVASYSCGFFGTRSWMQTGREWP